MNNENDKYIELIRQLKAAQVTLPNPQKLTSRTMLSIEAMSKKKSYIKPLTVIFWTSSIAAALLIGLFLPRKFFSSTNVEHKNLNVSPNYNLPVVGNNIYSEKSTVFNEFNRLIQLKKERQEAQRSFYLTLINKHKIS